MNKVKTESEKLTIDPKRKNWFWRFLNWLRNKINPPELKPHEVEGDLKDLIDPTADGRTRRSMRRAVERDIDKSKKKEVRKFKSVLSKAIRENKKQAGTLHDANCRVYWKSPGSCNCGHGTEF